MNCLFPFDAKDRSAPVPGTDCCTTCLRSHSDTVRELIQAVHRFCQIIVLILISLLTTEVNGAVGCTLYGKLFTVILIIPNSSSDRNDVFKAVKVKL